MENTILISKDFAATKYDKTLILFYESGCGACEDLLQDLPKKYEQLGVSRRNGKYSTLRVESINIYDLDRLTK